MMGFWICGTCLDLRASDDVATFMTFIKNEETRDIMFLEPYVGVRADSLFRRTTPVAVPVPLIVGAYSPYPREVEQL
jgi:hypothetical protein